MELYDCDLTLKKIFDTTIKIHSKHFMLTENKLVIDDQHINKQMFIDSTNRFYRALTEFQSTLPRHIVQMLYMYASQLLEGFKFKKHRRQHCYVGCTKTEPYTKTVTVEDLYDAVEQYFGVTLLFDYKPLNELMASGDELMYYIPVMDFIESRNVFGNKLDITSYSLTPVFHRSD
jgi:hypothetical protein